MEFKDIASISGKGGLFKVIKPTRTGVILEEISPTKKRMVAGLKQRVSLLDEIGIYTTDSEGAQPLKDVLRAIHKEFGEDIGIDTNADPEEMKAFLAHIVPEYDRNKVYVSDIKKLIGWYGILLSYYPDLLKEEEKKEEKADKKEPKKNSTKTESKSSSKESTKKKNTSTITKSSAKE